MKARAELSEWRESESARKLLNYGKRDVALAGDGLPRLIAIKEAAKQVAMSVRHGGMLKQTVVDELYEIAETRGLVDEIGSISVYTAIESGLNDFSNYHVPGDCGSDEPRLIGERPRDARQQQPQNVPKASRYIWRDPATIPPREWLYDRHFIRRYVSATIAAPDVGKTSLALAEAIAMTSGKPLLDVPVREPLRVWYFNLEDPLEEIERRAAAVMLHHGISDVDLGGRLFFNSGRDVPLIIGSEGRSGVEINHHTVDAVVGQMIAHKIDVLTLDPFVSAHRVGENDNDAIDHVIKYGLGAIAERTNAAVEFLHHVRKAGAGASDDRTIEDGRGASSIVGAIRSGRVLNRMSGAEADRLGIAAEDARLYLRVDPGKSNMARPAEKAIWRRLVSVDLGNATQDRPSDLVQAVVPWSPPDPMAGIEIDDLRSVQAAIAGGQFALNRQANNWAGYAVAKALNLTIGTKQANGRITEMLGAWIKSGALRIEQVHDARQGREKPIVVVGDPV